MSLNRYDARRDDNEKQIIDALEKAGFMVYRDLRVDLLLYHPVYGFDAMEVKSRGKPLKPKEGPQKEFVESTGCPIVNDPETAVRTAIERGKRKKK